MMGKVRMGGDNGLMGKVTMGVITAVGTVREPPLHPRTLSRRRRWDSAIFPLPIQGNRVLIGTSYDPFLVPARHLPQRRKAHREAQSISANLRVLCVSAVREIFKMPLPYSRFRHP